MGVNCSKSKDARKKALADPESSYKSINLLREERKIAEVNELLHRAEDLAEKAGNIFMDDKTEKFDDDSRKNVKIIK